MRMHDSIFMVRKGGLMMRCDGLVYRSFKWLFFHVIRFSSWTAGKVPYKFVTLYLFYGLLREMRRGDTVGEANFVKRQSSSPFHATASENDTEVLRLCVCA